jgi:mannose-6-phosphate isomerase-like protein (cupin superfamily)
MPVIEKFEPYEIPGKPWGTELVIAQTDTYMGKVLFMGAGTRGALQSHVRKDESFYLLSGTATVRWKTDDGVIQEAPMRQGEAYHVPVGAVHQVIAETQCTFLEVGLPVFDDRVPA